MKLLSFAQIQTSARCFIFLWLTFHLHRPASRLRPRQNGRHFADETFKCIFLHKNAWISIDISLKIAAEGPVNNIPSLVQIMAWRPPGDKPLSEPMMLISLLTHIGVTSRPQWVQERNHDTGTISVMYYKPQLKPRNNSWVSMAIWLSYRCRISDRKLCIIVMGQRNACPNSKVHGAYMRPTWGRQEPGGPHVGPMILAIWVWHHPHQAR